MARQARIKATDQPAWYHIRGRTSHYNGEYPLGRPGARRQLQGLIRRYAEAYFCQVSAFTLMGNHTHMVVHFEAPREVEREELRRRALLLYQQKAVDRWLEEAWSRLGRRLFDVSELMRNIQGQFGRWFNREFDRRGHFWGGRFDSSLLEGGEAVLDCMLYVELNPVRARLADAPEDWEHGSAFCRSQGRDGWLMPLEQALPGLDPEAAEQEYRSRLCHRGAVAQKEGQGVIPRRVLEDERRRGFQRRGAYRERQRHFTRGLVVGCQESVARWIAALQGQGRLPEGRRPVPQGAPGSPPRSFTLRAQRPRDGPG